jgi:hypothetical protein
VWISQPVVVQDLEQLGFIERGDRLAGLIMIDKDDLEPRRVEDIALAGNARIQAIFIHHPEIVVFIAQDTIEHVTDVGVGGELRHRRIGRVLARGRHHLPDGGFPGSRAKRSRKNT